MVRVSPKHASTDGHACGHRQAMPLGVRGFACGGCGLVKIGMSKRHETFSSAVLRWPGGTSALRVVPVRPRMFLHHMSPGQGAERCTAD